MHTCVDCGKEIGKPKDSFTTGYGVRQNGDKVCYDCCALEDKTFMETHDKISLYHSDSGPYGEEIINWPSTLRFNSVSFVGRHNWGLKRYDVYFIDHTGQKWHGVRIGNMTDLVHCKKIKQAHWAAESVLKRFQRENPQ